MVQKKLLQAGAFLLVGVTRLERATFRTPCECASQLRHTPLFRDKTLRFFPDDFP